MADLLVRQELELLDKDLVLDPAAEMVVDVGRIHLRPDGDRQDFGGVHVRT